VRRPRPPGSRATAIADNGLISGSRLLYYRHLDGFNYVTNATTWRDEYHFTQLAPERYTYRSWTYDVNSLGMVIGYVEEYVDYEHGLWTVRDGVVSGRTRFEVPIAHGSKPAAVNEHGHVAGYVSTWEDGRPWNRAVMWNGWTGELTHTASSSHVSAESCVPVSPTLWNVRTAASGDHGVPQLPGRGPGRSCDGHRPVAPDGNM